MEHKKRRASWPTAQKIAPDELKKIESDPIGVAPARRIIQKLLGHAIVVTMERDALAEWKAEVLRQAVNEDVNIGSDPVSGCPVWLVNQRSKHGVVK